MATSSATCGFWPAALHHLAPSHQQTFQQHSAWPHLQQADLCLLQQGLGNRSSLISTLLKRANEQSLFLLLFAKERMSVCSFLEEQLLFCSFKKSDCSFALSKRAKMSDHSFSK